MSSTWKPTAGRLAESLRDLATELLTSRRDVNSLDRGMLREAARELDRIYNAAVETEHAVMDTLAPALGYTCSDDYGWDYGDHSSVSLAMQAAGRIAELEQKNTILVDEYAALMELEDAR